MKKTGMVLAIFATLAAPQALGQEIRRCYIDGHVVLQEGRCPEAQTAPKDETLHGRYPVPVSGGTPYASNAGGSNPIEVGKALCRSSASRMPGWSDAESVTIGAVSGGQMTTMSIGSASVGVRKFQLTVSAKNRFGAFLGEKSLVCYTSEDGLRLLKMDDSLL